MKSKDNLPKPGSREYEDFYDKIMPPVKRDNIGDVICLVILITVIVSGYALAGPANLRDNVKVAERIADVRKKTDADAGVTYAQIKDKLQASGDAIDAVDLSTIDASAFNESVDQKTVIVAIKKAIQDLKIASKNMMQANNQLVKKLKQSEIIDKETK